ncbi:serine hydrolase [Pseudozobellia sp. WGM2]|uniref:serine hydrolase domain-containing protein n=1 Tax=Pseudozobellia sp. WGM2 TaxID=2787625 RepID=UPI001ADEC306|nr:serine hydrolase domain-containing protein [Pseudozobellia sp. WGM2]
MRTIKFLAVFALLTLTLIIATSSTKNSETSSTTVEKVTLKAPQQIAENRIDSKKYLSDKQKLKSALTTYFKRAIASGDIVGAGVSIVQSDSIVLAEGFGRRNYNHNYTVDGETVFRLGSLSKGFAGILAADLKNDGYLEWKDRIIDYLPQFQLGDARNTSEITLANILSHTSGTPYHSFTNLVEAGLPMETIASRFKEVVPISKPGTMYSYQNAIFALCSEVMQKATGSEISASLNNRFFKPLGMCSTSMDYKTLNETINVALPHSKRRNGWQTLRLSDNYYNAIAAGGINASAHDMAKWMRFLLGHNSEVLDKKAISEAFTPFIEIPGSHKYYHRWPGHEKSFYGFGWRIHKFTEDGNPLEKTIWHHGGSVNNYRNEIAMYPEADLGICVLLNSNSRIARTVIPDLYEIYKGIYEPTTEKLAQAANKSENNSTL